MDRLARSVEIIDELEKHSRRAPRAFEVTLDTIRELTSCFELCSDSDRAFIQEYISSAKAGLALVLRTSQIAARAIDTNCSAWIRVGLLAHVIEGFRWDPRENQLRFHFLAYASQRISADVEKIFEEVSHLATPHCAKHLRLLTSTSHKAFTLESQGFKEVKIDGRTKFVRT